MFLHSRETSLASLNTFLFAFKPVWQYEINHNKFNKARHHLCQDQSRETLKVFPVIFHLHVDKYLSDLMKAGDADGEQR